MQATRQSGFSLVELMIALLLGTLVVAAAGGIFLANRQTFRSTDNLGRVQEGMRTAFELMARDIREAAGNPCSNAVPLANVINTPTSRWWTNLENWGGGIRGYMDDQPFSDAPSGGGAGAGQRLGGTEAIELFATETPVRMVTAHAPASATFTLSSGDHGFVTGDLALACSPRHAALFQISAAAAGSPTIGHDTGGSPGNCTSALGVPVNCGTSNSYEFSTPNTVLARMHAVRWYVANNAAGRPALYQQRLARGADGGLQAVAQEVVEGVRSLRLTYLMRNSANYVDAAGVDAAQGGPAWDQVVAVNIRAEVEGEPNSGAAGAALARTVEHVVSLRNRNP